MATINFCDFSTPKNVDNKHIIQNINKVPWIEKYRPCQLSDIIMHTQVKNKLNTFKKKKNIPNLILTGEPGTGKTSTILCLAKRIIPQKYWSDCVLELNASDDRGLSMINNTILHFCNKKIDHVEFKIVILDEADSITLKAQNLLNNILELYIKNTRFVFICNDYFKIIESIQSRCTIINFPKLEKIKIKQKLKYICDQEEISYDDKSVDKLIFYSNNELRQTINYLECIKYTYGKLDEKTIENICDIPKPQVIKMIFDECKKKDIVSVIKNTYNIYKLGYSTSDIVLTMINMINNDTGINLSYDDKIIFLNELNKTYINVNEGTESLLQLHGCLSRIVKIL